MKHDQRKPRFRVARIVGLGVLAAFLLAAAPTLRAQERNRYEPGQTAMRPWVLAVFERARPVPFVFNGSVVLIRRIPDPHGPERSVARREYERQRPAPPVVVVHRDRRHAGNLRRSRLLEHVALFLETRWQ
jgi:hypothetical protein